ncbi:MAG: DNA polymerase III subunit delta [Chryseolinea sp.]
MKFSAIPGVEEVAAVLATAVRQNHIAHAQLFVGADGALNLPLALALATYLHCENKGDDSCGTCAACSKNAKLIHPDTHFVFPISNIKGDKDEDRFRAEMSKAWRSFIIEQPFGNVNDWTEYYGGEDKQAIISKDESREIIKALSLKPFESPYKVMIIWQPELMHPSAANGLLKILEEPAPYTFFILVTNAADKLLPTIISRSQIVTVPLLQDDVIESLLIEQHGQDRIKAARITQLANGNLNYATKLIDTEEDDNAKRFSEWMRACFKKNYTLMLSQADQFHALDRLSQKNMMHYSMNMMRETLLRISGASKLNRTKGDELQFIERFSKEVNDVARIDKSYILMNDATYHLERNGSAKMIFFDLSIQLSKTINP